MTTAIDLFSGLGGWSTGFHHSPDKPLSKRP